MAGGKGKIQEHPKANSNGFDKRPEDATKGGRKPSIRKQLEEMIGDNGNYTIAADQVLKVNDDGSVLVDIPTANKLTLKLLQWADSNKGNDSLKALQMIIEQIDGKPKQDIDVSGNLGNRDNKMTVEFRDFSERYDNMTDKEKFIESESLKKWGDELNSEY